MVIHVSHLSARIVVLPPPLPYYPSHSSRSQSRFRPPQVHRWGGHPSPGPTPQRAAARSSRRTAALPPRRDC